MKKINQYIVEKIKLSNDRFNQKANLEYVDLGLPSGTLWATCNIGANKPWEIGNYYAWAETEPKQVYNEETYEYTTEHGERFKVSNYTDIDSNTILKQTDDIAHINTYGKFVLPSKEQCVELIEELETKWVTDYMDSGVDGRLFIGKNGNELFFPLNGVMDGKNLVNDYAYLWTNKPVLDNTANMLYTGKQTYKVISLYRYYGAGIRGVLKK